MWKTLTERIRETGFRILSAMFPPVPVPSPADPKLILVFSTTGIGDALFDTAAVHALRTSYPSARIVVCVHRKRRTVFLHDPDADELVPYGKSPLYALRLIARFRRERPDLVLLLNINPEAVPVGYLINRRALFGGTWRCGRYGFLLSHPVDDPGEEHILRLGEAVVRAAGATTEARRMVYRPLPAELEAARSRFSGWIGRPFVIFQTGGGRSRAWRDWPVDSYVRNILWLRQTRPELTVVLTGGWDNEATAAAIERSCPFVVNLCNKTTLEETGALLSLAFMLVSTDTGVLFMAYAIGCPALAILHHASASPLIGPTDPGAGHEVVELPKPDHPTGELRGEMEKIPDEKVRAAIARILVRSGL
jgi:ADP-heptose:LPS heptosyltransferase